MHQEIASLIIIQAEEVEAEGNHFSAAKATMVNEFVRTAPRRVDLTVKRIWVARSSESLMCWGAKLRVEVYGVKQAASKTTLASGRQNRKISATPAN